jgi:hypothetical protein
MQTEPRTLDQLPYWLESLARNCPKTGRHQFVYRLAASAARYLDDHEIVELVLWATRACGRAVAPSEVERSLAVIRYREDNGLEGEAATPWPAPDLSLMNRTVRAHLITGLPPLEEHDTEWYIDQLFPDNPLITAARDKYSSYTRRRESWRGRLSDLEFIVPNVPTVWRAKTQDGRWSERCAAMYSRRHYLIIEFDLREKNEEGEPTVFAPLIRAWARDGISVRAASRALHQDLMRHGPYVVLIWSAGKSIHGWVATWHVAEPIAVRFFSYACRLGADPACWSKCQLVRMPNGLRSGSNKRQEVLFFDTHWLPTTKEGTIHNGQR